MDEKTRVLYNLFIKIHKQNEKNDEYKLKKRKASNG
jgi:hypothetical protein